MTQAAPQAAAPPPPRITEGLTGLSNDEVLAKRKAGEGNAVKYEASRTYNRIIFDNTVSPVNLTLFGISAVLLVLSLVGDAVLTASIVLGNVVVGIFQEARAKRQLDRIAVLTRPMATVLREGAEVEIDPSEIVRGDLLVVRPGDQIQADGRIMREEGLSVDEALLTGESDVVNKHNEDVLHAGTFVMTGIAVFEAEGVGTERLAHQITTRARTYKKLKTPLQKEVSLTIWLLAGFVLILAVATVISFSRQYGELPVKETTRAAAVIVAIIPQGLYFMVTITYAMAIVRLARTGALIQTMNAVESISHVDVLCLDKTGTLTTNRLRVEEVKPISGTEAELKERLGRFAVSGSFSNRTSAAIADEFPAQPWPVSEEVTFDSARKWSAIVCQDGPMVGLNVLGAPEMLQPHLANQEDTNGHVAEWLDKGLRVLLLANRPDLTEAVFDTANPQLPEALQAMGFVVLSDELRHDAADTVARFGEAGITLKILSGDHPDTVAALAEQAGFHAQTKVMAGSEVDGIPDGDLPRVVEDTTIFGRISPRHKEMLIEALKQHHHYVAMIGDGVNDVPALKASDVAVAMRSGSPVTRSVADIVLLEDSFSALPRAFLEGQRIRRGMQEIIRLFLIRSISVSLVILGAAIMNEAFPVTPRHTAVISMLTVGAPSVVLAAIARPGQSAQWLLRSALSFVIPAAVSIAFVSLCVYATYNLLDEPVNAARTGLTTTATLCGITLIPYAAHQTSAWLTMAPLRERPIVTWMTVGILGLFVLSIAVPILRDFYELDVLSVPAYAGILAVVAGWALLLKAIWNSGFAEKQLKRLGLA